MNKKIKKALDNGRLFQVYTSYIFALNIPDDNIGISGSSRCSHCGTAGAYCLHLCRGCGFPLAGPFGLPSWEKWKLLSKQKRDELARNMFNDLNHGRIRYQNAHHVPLSPFEAQCMQNMTQMEKMFFQTAHGISVDDLLYTIAHNGLKIVQ